MRIPMVAVPDWRVACCSMITETIDHELYCCGCVCDEDKIKVFRIGIEEPQGTLTYRVDSVSCQS